MTPRLLLLTGPAADQVENVLHEARLAGEPGAFEVREYWRAPRQIADASSLDPEGHSDHEAAEEAIRSLPSGEAWLVGLVLPDHACGAHGGACDAAADGARIWDCEGCRWETFADLEDLRLPARLAILAPSPPPLLVERVKAWGGEAWECTTDHKPHSIHGKKPCGIMARNTGRGDTFWDGNTWPEAVRAALGEVAPC